jgi:hypothetical protein
MHAWGHQHEELHVPSDLGPLSQTRRVLIGARTLVVLNHQVGLNSTPPQVVVLPASGWL